MRTNIESLAIDFYLDDEFDDEQSSKDISIQSYEGGFKKCLELVKPLLEKSITALNTLDDLEFNQLTPELEQFLEEYE